MLRIVRETTVRRLLFLAGSGSVEGETKQPSISRTIPKPSTAATIGLLVAIGLTSSGSRLSEVHAQETLPSVAVDLGGEPAYEPAEPTAKSADGPSLGSPGRTQEFMRLPNIGDPPDPLTGVEKIHTGDGDTLERLPATIQNLWTTNPESGALGTDTISGDLARPVPYGRENRETPPHLLDDPDAPWPPVFVPPGAGCVESVDEPLSANHDRKPPPTDERLLPRAYVPPSVLDEAPLVRWSPWWSSAVGQASLLSAQTAAVNLQQLMSLALRNSPVVQLARIDVNADCGASRSKVDQMVLEVAQHYWQTYQWRVSVIIRRRLYHDARKVRDQLDKLVGDAGAHRQLMLLAESTARERSASLAAAEAALRNAQNQLANVVSVPSWEQERELLPQDHPFSDPYHVDEAAEMQNALARRPELLGTIRRIQRASSHHQVVSHRVMPQLMAAFRKPVAVRAATAPIQVYSFMSPEIEAISDRIKLDVKNAIVRLTGSYENMRRYADATQAAAQEVTILGSRWGDLSGSDPDLPLYFRDLLDAQARLASLEQHFVAAQTSYSTAILELRRANGTIIDQSAFRAGGPVTGPGVPRPTKRPAVVQPATEYHPPEPQRERPRQPAGVPTDNEPLREPAESMFQAPQERLDVAPQTVDQRPSRHVPSVPRQQGPMLRVPETRGVDVLKQMPSIGPETTAPQTPGYYAVPQGELPMPRGEILIPGGDTETEDVSLYAPSFGQQNSREDWGRASSIVPPRRQQGASPWGPPPVGEVPLPAGEQLIPRPAPDE